MKKTLKINVAGWKQEEINLKGMPASYTAERIIKLAERNNLMIDDADGIENFINDFMNDNFIIDSDRMFFIETDEEEDIEIKAVDEPEEWYEILSELLDDNGISHKIASTGTIYINDNIRIGDHDANGSNKEYDFPASMENEDILEKLIEIL